MTVSAPIVDEIRRLKTQLKEIRTSNEIAYLMDMG